MKLIHCAFMVLDPELNLCLHGYKLLADVIVAYTPDLTIHSQKDGIHRMYSC